MSVERSSRLFRLLALVPPDYRRAFWKSRHHLWLALLSLGIPFATGEPLALIAGATCYALGLVFLPDSAFFRRAVDAHENSARDSAAAAERAAFAQEQEKLLAALSTARRTRHQQLVAVCADIESASTEGHAATDLGAGTRRQKLAELTWTYLRMLSVEQSLEVYLETERREQLPAAARTLETETQTLAAEVAVLGQTQPPPAALAGKQRLLTSRLERLAALRQRLTRVEQAQANHDLLRSEQERLVEQVKLIRADAIASKNADTLTARIDHSIEHLATTNRWISELAEFKDLTARMPSMDALVPPVTPPARGKLPVSE